MAMITGGSYIHIAEAIEAEAKQLDDIRSMHDANDKMNLAVAKALISGAVFDLFVGEVNSARIRMDRALDSLSHVVHNARDEHFVDVMQAIDWACYRKIAKQYIEQGMNYEYDG